MGTEAPPYVRLSSVGTIRELAESAGHYQQFYSKNLRPSTQPATTLVLMDLMTAISELYRRLGKVKYETTWRNLERATGDLTQKCAIDRQYEATSTLLGHLQLVLANQNALLARLQRPYVGQGIDLDPNFHGDLVELVPALLRFVQSYDEGVPALTWAGNYTVDGHMLDQLLGRASTLLATWQSYSQALAATRDTTAKLAAATQL